MKRLLLMIFPALLLSACASEKNQADTSMRSQDMRTPITAQSSASPSADNTAINKTDRNFTAEQQSNDKNNVQLTANVRKTILKQKGLSIDAQNIKIISEQGNVILRGPVDNIREKLNIAKLVKNVYGVSSVDNQLELKNKPVASRNGGETFR